MDFTNYDDYMRSTLGFSGMGSPMDMQGACCSNMSNMNFFPYANMSTHQMWQNQTCNLEGMYPDSYKVIYPMVVATCRNVSMPITEDMLEQMVDTIYNQAINDDRIKVDVSIEINNRDSKDSRTENSEDRQSFNRPPRRPRRNRFLNDFIRVLLLRELLGGRPRF